MSLFMSFGLFALVIFAAMELLRMWWFDMGFIHKAWRAEEVRNIAFWVAVFHFLIAIILGVSQ